MADTNDKKIKKSNKEVAEKTSTAPVSKKTSDSERLIPDSGLPVGETEKQIAKAGRRSAKAIKEAEEKEAKEARKVEAKKLTAKSEKPKAIIKPPRSRLERAGKKYQEASKLIDKTKLYPLAEAMEVIVKTSPTKFDATVELHINLGVDPKQADQNIRGTTVLPAGSGKNLRVAVFTEADDIEKAKKAGADIAGADELAAKLDKEQIEFDILVAPPNLMPRLSKYARLLGPRGLMPNPKSGTVTTDITKAVKEAKTGRLEYRTDSSGIIHLSLGKASFGAEKLLQNSQAVLTSIRAAKPASLKGTYIKSTYVTTTMGPSIKVEV